MNTLVIPTVDFRASPPQRQQFSIPESIVYYIARNPSSPELYQKLIRTCKYFFQKNPMLVVTCITGNYVCDTPHPTCGHRCARCVRYDVHNSVAKLWPTYRLCHRNMVSKFDNVQFNLPRLDLLSTKIGRNDLRVIDLCSNDTIIVEHFKMLAENCKSLFMTETKIVHGNGEIVPLDEVLECIPQIEVLSLQCYNGLFSFKTSENMLDLGLHHLKKLTLKNVPDTWNIDNLRALVIKQKTTSFFLEFDAETIGYERKDELDELVHDFMKYNVPHCMLKYEGQAVLHKRQLFRRWLAFKVGSVSF